MDMLQMFVQRLSLPMPQLIEKFTNKDFLHEEHKKCIEQLAKMDIAMKNQPDLTFLQQTSTTEMKSTTSVSLCATNRVNIKTIATYVNNVNAGKFLLCRSICPPAKLTALTTIVDDPEGSAVRLSLYNFVSNVTRCSANDAYHYLPVGTIIAIKNPWFKSTTDGGLSVRCDNPGEVVILDQSTVDQICPGIKWNGEIPKEYQPKYLVSSQSMNWKRIGNEHFVFKRYKEAISAYSNAMKQENNSKEEQVILWSNRSAAYLGLLKFNLALTDAETALAIDKNHTKCIYRKTKALFGMALYRDAMKFLKKVSTPELTEKDREMIDDLVTKAESFIAQSEKGEYPWKELYTEEPVNVDLAEFKGAVIVKKSDKKGRGLFATKTIKAGELVLVSKAFAYVNVECSDDLFFNFNFERKLINDKSQTQLESDIANILKENPEKCRDVYNLYAGPKLGFLTYEDGSRSEDFLVDIKRIHEICTYNSFGSKVHSPSEASTTRTSNSGLWITPSYANHSCVDANCSWRTIQDFIFFRAFFDIPEGEEILITYYPPFQLISQNDLDKYDFICECRLCLRDRMDSETTQTKRKRLVSQMTETLKKYKNQKARSPIADVKNDEIEIRRLMKQFMETRKDAPQLNLCLYDTLMDMSIVYYLHGFYLKSATTLHNLYNMIKDNACFCYESLEISLNIISGLLLAGEIIDAKKWIKIAKDRVMLAYGTGDIIEIRFPLTVNTIREYGLDI